MLLKNAIPLLIVLIKNCKIVIDRKSVFSKDQQSKDYVNPLRNILFAKLKFILIDSKILEEIQHNLQKHRFHSHDRTMYMGHQELLTPNISSNQSNDQVPNNGQ